MFLKHPYKRFCFSIFFIFSKRDLSLSLSLFTHSISPFLSAHKHTLFLYLSTHPLALSLSLFFSLYPSLFLHLRTLSLHTLSISFYLYTDIYSLYVSTHTVSLYLYTHYFSTHSSSSLFLSLSISAHIPYKKPYNTGHFLDLSSSILTHCSHILSISPNMLTLYLSFSLHTHALSVPFSLQPTHTHSLSLHLSFFSAHTNFVYLSTHTLYLSTHTHSLSYLYIHFLCLYTHTLSSSVFLYTHTLSLSISLSVAKSRTY